MRKKRFQETYLTLFVRLFLAKICWITPCLFFVYSCTLYPHYKRPCVEMPKHWRSASDEMTTVTNLKWWERLGDPVLNDLIEEALESNNDLQIATARIAQFYAQLGVVSSQLYPQIDAQGSLTRQKNSQTLRGNPSTSQSNQEILQDLSQFFPTFSNDYRAVITASYELDLWGKIRSAKQAAFADFLGQVNARRVVILSVVSSVAASYIFLRQYDQQLQIVQQTVRSWEESYRLAKLRFEEGSISELEVAQSAAQLDEAIIQVIQIETRIAQKENLLSMLIGHSPSSITRGRSLDEFCVSLEIPAGLPADLLEQRPDILQAEDKLKAANFRIGEARALYFPDITLTGYYGGESAELHKLFTNPSSIWQWMNNLLQPIFTGGKITSNVDLTKAQKQEAVYNYLKTIVTALQEVEDALIGHKNAKRTVEAELAKVKDLDLYVQLATLQYENGLVDYLNVLDAERRLFQAQLDLVKDQADVFIALVNIYKALGGGWVI